MLADGAGARGGHVEDGGERRVADAADARLDGVVREGAAARAERAVAHGRLRQNRDRQQQPSAPAKTARLLLATAAVAAAAA